MGAQVTGFALEPASGPTLFDIAEVGRDLDSIVGDLRDRNSVDAAVEAANAQLVIHMAAQALVRESVRDPVGTLTDLCGFLIVLSVAARILPRLTG